MRIPFAAYADDCTVTGEVELDRDRLSDFLASTDELEVSGAAFRALDDGRVVETESASLTRGDLCVVTATGPRGRPERRVWTRQFRVRARVGPFSVVGYLHAPPSVDPFKAANERIIVPLTDSIVEYSVVGEVIRDAADAVLLNGLKIDRLEQVEKEELGLDPDPSPPADEARAEEGGGG